MGRWPKWASWTNFVTAMFFVMMCLRAWEMWNYAPEWFKSALLCATLAYVVRMRLAHLGPSESASPPTSGSSTTPADAGKGE